MPDSTNSETFEQARLRFFDGLAALEAGRFEDAERHCLAALQLVPGRVSTLVNLAAIWLRLGQTDKALAAADQVLQIDADNRDAWLHRASALGRLGRLPEALTGFDKLLALGGPGQALIWGRRAETLHALGRREEALAAYRRSLELDAAQPEVWSRSGDILRESERAAEAAQAYRRAIEHGAHAELNAYYLAAVERDAVVPGAAPRAYVEALFDSYADDFEQHLVGQLGYRAHAVLTAPLPGLRRGKNAAAKAAGKPFGAALDLGCGTGLCGPLVRPWVERLIGVDVSAAMLERARSLGVYDDLLQADLSQHLAERLQQRAEPYDLVLAADVFIYVGDLAPVFASVHAATRAGALFCFTVELAGAGHEVQLLSSLRYAHSEAHVRRLAAEHGFGIEALVREAVRHDQRRPIEGLYVYLRRE